MILERMCHAQERVPPEAVAGYKVYVVLESGRERGSEPVFVTRPV
jgi:hypothetical protein